MTALPKMSRSRSSRTTHPCVCGCSLPTKGTWHPGHDGRATGWALRIERGVLTLDQVPEGERNGARLMLERRGTKVEGQEVAA